VKRIPPSASATVIFAAKYISPYIPGSVFSFTVTLLEHNAHGGMRCAFPPYGF
jgi:hypothetical protein